MKFSYKIQLCNNYFLFLFIRDLNWNSLKIKVFPDPVFEISGIRRLYVLGQVAKESKDWIFGRQLGDIFYLNIFPFPCRWRISFDLRQHNVIQFRGRYLLGFIFINPYCQFYSLENPLLIYYRCEDDGDPFVLAQFFPDFFLDLFHGLMVFFYQSHLLTMIIIPLLFLMAIEIRLTSWASKPLVASTMITITSDSSSVLRERITE